MSADARQGLWCVVVRADQPREVGLQHGTSGAVATVAVSVWSGDLPDTGLYELVEDANVGAAQRVQQDLLAQTRKEVRRSLAVHSLGRQSLATILQALSLAELEQIQAEARESGPEAARRLLTKLDPTRDVAELSDSELADRLRTAPGERLAQLALEAADRLDPPAGSGHAGEGRQADE